MTRIHPARVSWSERALLAVESAARSRLAIKGGLDERQKHRKGSFGAERCMNGER